MNRITGVFAAAVLVTGISLGCQTCPNCRATVFAAEGADMTGTAIKYQWTCDLCGHSFTTEAPFEEIAE